MASFLQTPPSSPLPEETMELTDPARSSQVADHTPVNLPGHNHPSYAEMITAAVAALKEPKGSTKQSIARYIEKVYSDLPQSHSSLLTQHLKRMKNTGQLVMVKNSYKLPRSPSQQPPEPMPQVEEEGYVTPVASTKKKGGRPPKLKPQTQLQQDSQQQTETLFESEPEHVQEQVPLTFRDEAEFEVQPFDAQDSPGVDPDSVIASLGLADEPHLPLPQSADATLTKKRPGRPRKIKLEDKSPAPHKSLTPSAKRDPGHSPKSGLVTSSGRPRGRPKSNNSSATAKSSGKPRGRPKKSAHHFGSVAGGSPINVPISDNNGSPTATTYATPTSAVAAASNGGALLSTSSKRRGRPPKSSTQSAALLSEGPQPSSRSRGRPKGSSNKSQKPSGRSRGRPRKDTPLIAAPIAYNSTLQGEHEQLKSAVKEAARVIKPFLSDEVALAALKNLEEVAGNGASPEQES